MGTDAHGDCRRIVQGLPALKAVFSLRFRRLGREFVWLTVGEGLTALGGMVGVYMLTRFLDPIIYGRVALGMTVATLSKTTVFPVSQGFTRFFAPAREADQLSLYWRAVLTLLWRVTAITLCAAALFVLGLVAFDRLEWLGLILAAFAFALVSGYDSALGGIQNAARQRATGSLHNAAGQWLRFLAAVLLIVLLGASSDVTMLGYSLGVGVVLGSRLVFFRRAVVWPNEVSSEADENRVQEWATKMLSYSWPFVTWGVIAWLHQSSDRWALHFFSGSDNVGLYAVVYQIGYYPMMMLSGLVTKLVSPVLFERAGDGSEEKRVERANQLNNLTVLVTVVLAVVGFVLALLLHQQVFAVLVAPKYHDVSALLPWMILSSGLFATGQNVATRFLTCLSTPRLIGPKIVSMLLGVGLNFAGARWFGLRGVVFAGLFSSMMYFGWMLSIAQSSKE